MKTNTDAEPKKWGRWFRPDKEEKSEMCKDTIGDLMNKAILEGLQEGMEEAMADVNTPIPLPEVHSTGSRARALDHHFEQTFYASRTLLATPDEEETQQGSPLEFEWDSELMGDECLPMGWEDEEVDDNGDTHWNPSWKND